MTETQAVYRSAESAVDYEPYPLDTVVDGELNGEVHWLRRSGAHGGFLEAGIFKGDPCVFTYEFGEDETFHMLEGEVKVQFGDEAPVTFGPGDLVSVPKGVQSTWTVVTPFKKFFVLND